MKVFLLLILMSSFTAFGATTKKSKEEVKKEEKKSESLKYTVNESEMNREDLNYQATLYIAGAALSLPSSGIGFYKFLNENELVGINYYSMKDNDDLSLYDGTAISLSYKKFNGNSFYFEGYVYYRNIKTIDKISIISFGGSTTETREGEADYEDLGVGLKIGNQWQWDNFTLGCDWIGVAKRVATLSYDGEKSDFYNSNSNTTLLNFYLGYSF